jgi:hypothetical protein
MPPLSDYAATPPFITPLPIRFRRFAFAFHDIIFTFRRAALALFVFFADADIVISRYTHAALLLFRHYDYFRHFQLLSLFFFTASRLPLLSFLPAFFFFIAIFDLFLRRSGHFYFAASPFSSRHISPILFTFSLFH